MAVGALRRLAASGPARVHAVPGAHGLHAVEALSVDPRLTLAASVRQASVLLVVGALREADRPELRRLHDQMPHPRATLWWRTQPDPAFSAPRILPDDASPVEAIVEVHRALMLGERSSEPDLLPDEPPNPWRGEGDHGQGGKGMMGGTPYGRPMPMTDDDLRDGLALDAYTTEMGPFLPVFPPGLKLQVTLQGDVIQSATVKRPPLPQRAAPEAAEALRLVARQLCLLGLAALGERVLRAAVRLEAGESVDLGRLRRIVARTGAERAIPPGLATFGGTDVRRRLDLWWETAAGGAPLDRTVAADARLVDLLPGLEWHEAMLVLNSFAPATLLRMCPVAETEDEGHRAMHGHHGHGGHAGQHGHPGHPG